MRKTAAWPLTLAFVALVVYASLYPFINWRDQGVLPWAYLTQPLPKYWTWFDVLINIAGYAPLGFLGVLTALRTGHGKFAVLLVTFLVFLLSMVLEGLQSYLPSRVASNVDLSLNTLGGWLGGFTAWSLEKFGAIDRWSHFRRTWFIAQARGGLVLLALWPIALISSFCAAGAGAGAGAGRGGFGSRFHWHAFFRVGTHAFCRVAAVATWSGAVECAVGSACTRVDGLLSAKNQVATRYIFNSNSGGSCDGHGHFFGFKLWARACACLAQFTRQVGFGRSCASWRVVSAVVG
jgi:VanZ family protein